MKYHGDRKYLYWGLTAFAVICATMLFYYCLFHGTSVSSIFSNIVRICAPILIGLFLAYLITPIINSLEHRMLIPLIRKWKKDKNAAYNRKIVRVIAILLAYLLVFLAIYALFASILPEIQKSILSIIGQLPETFNKYYGIVLNYINNNETFSRFLEDNLSFDISSIDQQQIYNLIITQIENVGSILSTLSTTIFTAIKTVLNVAIGLIISVYLVYDKENFAARAKKITYSLMEKHNANQLIKDCRFIHKTFIGFIAGKIFDSIIIGLLCYVGTILIGLHYPILISVIVGVTNVIPFFGPYLGAIPCALLLLLIRPIETVYFLIFILILQQIDGNIIGPKILGNSTGISGFWVIFAITFFGGFYGILGMFIGVPVFAVIYAFVKRFVNRKLKSRGLPSETEKYEEVYEIQGDEFIRKEHLYTEIKNPKYKGSHNKLFDSGRYHLFHFLGKHESSDEKDEISAAQTKNTDKKESDS